MRSILHHESLELHESTTHTTFMRLVKFVMKYRTRITRIARINNAHYIHESEIIPNSKLSNSKSALPIIQKSTFKTHNSFSLPRKFLLPPEGANLQTCITLAKLMHSLSFCNSCREVVDNFSGEKLVVILSFCHFVKMKKEKPLSAPIG